MKIAITSAGEDLNAMVDERFGRARNFMIVDTDTGEWSVLSNRQNYQAAQGAGIQASAKVCSAGVAAVLTGYCGPKAFQVLQSAGVDVFAGASGTVAEAVDAFREGRLAKADSATVEQHFGSV